jgi:hypothetical protein
MKKSIIAVALFTAFSMTAVSASQLTYGSNSNNFQNITNSTVIINGNGNTVINGVSVNGKTSHRKEKVETKTVAVAAFSGISINAPAKIKFVKSEKSDVVVEAGATVLEHLKTTVADDTLSIDLEGVNVATGPIVMTIHGPGFSSLTLASSGSFSASDLAEQSMEVRLSGSGTISLSGTAKALKLDLAGSGDIFAKDLHASDLKINLVGSGDIQAKTDLSVDATLIGSGDIDIFGIPLSKKISKTGSGDINFIQ